MKMALRKRITSAILLIFSLLSWKLFALEVTLDRGNVILVSREPISCIAQSSGATGFEWQVNNVVVQNGSSSTYSFSETPSGETKYTLKVIASDGTASVQAEVSIWVLSSSPRGYYAHSDAGWLSMGIPAPSSVIESFYYEDKVTIRMDDGAYYQYDSLSNRWETIGIIASPGVVKSFSPQEGALLNLLSSGAVAGFIPTDLSWQATNIVAPSGFSDLAMGGGVVVLTTDLHIRSFMGSWVDTEILAPAGTTQLLYHQGQLYAKTSGNILSVYSMEAEGWESSGIILPEGTLELFSTGNDPGGDLIVRK